MTRREQIMIGKIVDELSKRELNEHLGRWTEITMKKSGRVFEIVRTGYGPMEYPEKDSHEIKENGIVIAEFKSLYGVAKWLLSNR